MRLVAVLFAATCQHGARGSCSLGCWCRCCFGVLSGVYAGVFFFGWQERNRQHKQSINNGNNATCLAMLPTIYARADTSATW